MLGAVARGERFSQALNCPVGLVVVEGCKGGVGALEPADGLKRVIDLSTVEDWLADILDVHALETSALE